MIDLLKILVSFKTIYNNDELPFGKENKLCLNKILEIAKNDGFRVKNLDNYCGYIEIGSGKEIIGIVAHLDVVPASNNWKTDPFTLTIKDNYLYGRGVSDDKGAVVASYYALKELNYLKLNKRVRLILGCNEENGSSCMKHYNKVEEKISYGFTPDGDFPCINGEKGIIQGNFKSINTTIKNINGGIATNVVSDYCKIELNGYYNKAILEDYLNINNLKFNINDSIIEVFGNSTHASTPDLGLNAISYLLCGLKYAGYKDDFIDFYFDTFNTYNDARNIGLNLEDEYSKLTINIGKINMIDNIIIGSIDIRFPVTMKYEDIVSKLNVKSKLGKLEFTKYTNPLYYDPNSVLVKTLLNTYNNVMNTNLKPLIIGGGTYAKEINNTIAFGCAFPNKDYKIHDDNEFVTIEELELQKKLYKEAILNLLCIK